MIRSVQRSVDRLFFYIPCPVFTLSCHSSKCHHFSLPLELHMLRLHSISTSSQQRYRQNSTHSLHIYRLLQLLLFLLLVQNLLRPSMFTCVPVTSSTAALTAPLHHYPHHHHPCTTHTPPRVMHVCMAVHVCVMRVW